MATLSFGLVYRQLGSYLYMFQPAHTSLASLAESAIIVSRIRIFSASFEFSTDFCSYVLTKFDIDGNYLDQLHKMEPVGIAASLLTLIAVSKKVADTGLVLVRRYRGYPAAQAVIRDRSTQLDVQLSLLSDAKKAISELDILSDELKKKILEAVGDTCVTLKLIRDDLAQHSDERGIRARIRYAQRGEAEFQDWFKKLDENYQALTYKFSILNM